MNINIKNKKAYFNYFIEDTFEAGLVLEGWEFKSLLKNKGSIENSYITIKDGELFLFGSLIEPLETTSEYHMAQSMRTRKLLMHRREINKLIGLVQRNGYTLIPLKIERKQKIKLSFGLAKGKQNHDKRQSEKDKDWNKEKSNLLKHQ